MSGTGYNLTQPCLAELAGWIVSGQRFRDEVLIVG